MTITTRAASAAALSLATAALLSACSGPAKPAFVRPNPDEFRTGTCHDAAPALLAVGDIGTRLAGARAVPDPDNKVLTAQQRRLIGLRTSAELSQPVNDLVVAIGFVRLRADSHTYDDPRLMTAVVDAQQKVVRNCVPS
ncbi:MAG: hypothetical protein V7637_3966 [Mycobacteriales bacterium]